MKLPSVFANKIEKDINNNVSYYHNDRRVSKDLNELKGMFDSKGYANRLMVRLEMSDGTVRDEKLILSKDSYFININNEKIYYKDIINYEIKK